jgi:hypothetical protein
MYGSAMHWRGKFRMWYCGWTRTISPRACYAESDDGVVWVKPNLGLNAFEGSRENNVILHSMSDPKGLIDDLTVIDDADDAEWPLKMLFWDGDFTRPDGVRGICAARSRDGIHWERLPGMALPNWGDRFNALPVKQDGKYVVYGRAPMKGGVGRSVWRSESPDLIQWSQPQLVLTRDVEDPAYLQYYSVSVFPYESLVLGGLERMHFSPDKLDTELIFSHDGSHWERARTRPSFLPWGADGAWDDTWANLPASAPIRWNNQLWFLYSGRSGAHGVQYPYNTGGIGLATLRLDGFASLKAEAKDGWVVTPAMTWPDADLSVNFDPRGELRMHPGEREGELSVEARGEDGLAVPGYSWADCAPFRTNTERAPNGCMPIQWKEGRSLRTLAGRNIRLAFRFRSGHLFSFRAGKA